MPDLYRAPFPLYTIKVDPKSGLVITAGGGGASKTGIKNAVVSKYVFCPYDIKGGAKANNIFFSSNFYKEHNLDILMYLHGSIHASYIP